MKQYNKSPFKLENTEEYEQWREQKLSHANTGNNKRVINLKKTPPHFLALFQNNSLDKPSYSNDSDLKKNSIENHNENGLDNIQAEIETILDECNRDSYCLYSIDDYKNFDLDETKNIIRLLATSCGLSKLDGNLCADDDGLTSITPSVHKGQHEYIPYTNKQLSWHTDGYYNLPENTINSMLLHCYQVAENGGESAFMDHEIAYILLRDENPKWIEALSHNKVMTIPANVLDGKVIRPEQTGPVFSITPQGRLHMRYSARQRNIVWNSDNRTLDAVRFLQELLTNNNAVDDYRSKYVTRYKLKTGEGIISRNILHCRTSFDNDEQSEQQRLLLRGRFYDEVCAPTYNKI